MPKAIGTRNNFADFRWYDFELPPGQWVHRVLFEYVSDTSYLITTLEGQLLAPCTPAALADLSLELTVSDSPVLHMLINMITVADVAIQERLHQLEEMLTLSIGEPDSRLSHASRLVAVAKKMGWTPRSIDRRVLVQPILVKTGASNELRLRNASSETIYWRLVVGHVRSVTLL